MPRYFTPGGPCRRNPLSGRGSCLLGRHIGPPIPGGNHDPFRDLIKTCSGGMTYETASGRRFLTTPIARSRRPKRMTHRPGRRSMRRGTNTTAAVGWHRLRIRVRRSLLRRGRRQVPRPGSIARMGRADRGGPPTNIAGSRPGLGIKFIARSASSPVTRERVALAWAPFGTEHSSSTTTGRYFALTGDVFGAQSEIADLQGPADALYALASPRRLLRSLARA